MTQTTWTLALLFGALSSFTEACMMPPRIYRYNLLDEDGYEKNLKGASELTGIEKFKKDWGAEDTNLKVTPWSQDPTSFAVSWDTPGGWQKVSKSFNDLTNLDVLPYITALSFEFSTSDDYNVRGDEYTVNLAVTSSKDYSSASNGTLYESIQTGNVDQRVHPWHRYRHLLELGHYDLTKDQSFHVAINGDQPDGSPGTTMADYELFFEIWLPILNYQFDTHLCRHSAEARQFTMAKIDTLQIGMQYDLTFQLPWIRESRLEVDHWDAWFIHSAYDFDQKKCHLAKSFYDCFSREEELINGERYPDIIIDGSPGKPRNLTIKKSVKYSGKFYITHVIGDKKIYNKYGNMWQSWTFDIKDAAGTVPTPEPSPYPEPEPIPYVPTPEPEEPEVVDPHPWPSEWPEPDDKPVDPVIPDDNDEDTNPFEWPTDWPEPEDKKPIEDGDNDGKIDDTAEDQDDTGDQDDTTKTDDEPIINASDVDVIDDESGWLHENEWLIGIFYLIVGPLIALFGQARIGEITALLAAIFVFTVGLTFCMGLGWCSSTGGAIGVFFLLLVFAILAAVLLRNEKWLRTSIIGVIAGWFIGAFVFSFVASASGWEEEWGYWFFTCMCAVIGWTVACQYKDGSVIALTSIIGSYLFMRAWTQFFPNAYPNESRVVSGRRDEDNFSMTWQFWVFVLVFAACITFSIIFQTKLYNRIEEENEKSGKGSGDINKGTGEALMNNDNNAAAPPKD